MHSVESHAEWLVAYWRKQADAQAVNIHSGNSCALATANTYRECANTVARLILGAPQEDDVPPFPSECLWAVRDMAREDVASGNVWPEGGAS